MALIYNATFDKNTRKLSFEDKAGNEIYSFTVPERGPAVDNIRKPLTFKATQDGSTVKLSKTGSPSGSFQTSRDGGNTWEDYTTDTAITLNTSDEVSFRAKADRTTDQSDKNYFGFQMTGKIEAWHNVMSLYRTNDFSTYEYVVSYAFSGLFSGCTSLTKAPVLPATTLGNSCYSSMFSGCTSLTKAPDLPATTLDNNCYKYMFKGCTSLSEAPALPATALSNYCYKSMFEGCTSLTEAPELPATTLANFCYYSMFNGCTSLTKAPKLPVTTLAEGCYGEMFSGCTSLSEAPKLPATTLITDCYGGMFQGCTSLMNSPELPATTLANRCYKRMFNGCSSLNEVRCKIPSSYSSSTISSYAANWLSNVSSTGTFYTNADANWPSGVSGIPTSWTRVNEGAPTVDGLTKPLTFKATQGGSTVKLTKNGSPDGTFQTSGDGGNTWTDYTIGTAITLNAGEEVSFRAKADRTSGQSSSNYFYFEMTGKIEAWHNVMSLYRKDDFATYNTVVNYAFHKLFNGCTSITKAPVLPATTLAKSCYYHMFYDCYSLTKAPELPATTLAESCYSYMFGNCTSLTKAPVLPATTLAKSCYSRMFDVCTSLTKAPELPVTTLAESCYSYMFANCNSLTKAPELPATTLDTRCYSYMFKGCTSLTKAPALPSTALTLACYEGMFNGCTSLTEAPALTATTLAPSCYSGMLRDCTSLAEAPALPATTLSGNCYQYMFQGCTSLTKAPELPATTLANYCYYGMFKGCTSLTKAPALPETTLKISCYSNMFSGCSSLNEVRCKIPSSYSAENISSCAKDWLSNVAPTGTFYTNADANWPSGVSGIPTGWNRVNEGAPAVDNITKPLTFRATQDSSTVKLSKNGTVNGEFQTSRDGGNTWTNYTIGTDITLNNGDEVSFRAKADREFEQSDSNYFQFNMTGKIEAWHNVMSLYRTSDFATYNTVVRYSFYQLFRDCESLIKAPALPATTLANNCYNRMFRDCTSLTEAPVLPATDFNSFDGSIDASNCYDSMFWGCTSLTKAPELPATILEESCYEGMFSGCASLTKAPELPSTTLAFDCYSGMFNYCTSLVNAPALPATTLKQRCYYWMFARCISLTKAPELTATKLASECYLGMFLGCGMLNEVHCQMPSTISAGDVSKYTGGVGDAWLYGVASTGTFYTNSDANWYSGESGIPYNWTRVNA